MVAEKNSVCRSAGMAAMMRLMVGQEAHVEHAVGFIQHQDADVAQVDQLRLRKSYSRPGVAISTCAPLRMDCSCGFFADAADYDGGADRAAGGHFGEGLVDLDGQFAGGAQDDGADAGARRFIGEQVNDGQDKRERLAGPGLRRGNHVASGQRRLDGLGLDGGGLFKAVLRQIALQESGEGEFRETFHF